METSNNASPTAAIIGGVAGASVIVVVLVLVGLCIICVWKNCKKRNDDSSIKQHKMTVIKNSTTHLRRSNTITTSEVEEKICKCPRYNKLIKNNIIYS